MAKNADTTVADDDTKVTEEDLRKAKYGEDDVESSDKETDEASEAEGTEEESEEAGDDDGKTDTDAEEDESEEEDKTASDEDDSEFVKEFPNIKGDTLEDYARSLESTIRESSNEGKRLADENKTLRAQLESKDTGTEDKSADNKGPIDPNLLYAQRLVNQDVEKTFAEFKKSYPQTDDPIEYQKFQDEAAALQGYYLSRNQILIGSELYTRVASNLGWQSVADKPDDKTKLGVALKNKAAITKTSSAVKQVKKSKVTDQMLAVNRLMYPNKTDAEIIAELEPHVK